MPDETRRLLSAAERLAAVVDTLSAEFAAELQAVLRQTERRLGVLLRTLQTPRQPGERTRQAEAARLLVLRDQVREVLREAGYDRLAETAASASIDRLASVVQTTRVGQQVTRFLTRRLAAQVDALRVLATTDLLRQGDLVADVLYRAVRDGVLAGTPAPVLLERVAEALDREVSEVRTLYDTTTATFGRVMEQQDSTGAADELFLYAGPVDAKMRPFCADHIGKVYTRDAIVRLDNGQNLDVLLTAGGYNCRHVWMRLSDFSELAPLANTGARAPEVVDALADVRPVRRARAA